MKTIAAHTVVKNEARFVWFAVMSVIDHVDKVVLRDTGSTDGTIEILQEIEKRYPKKVNLKLVRQHTPEEFTKIRQQMLDATDTDWFIVVDADEIWWEESIREVCDFIRKDSKGYESLFVPTKNLIGDIFHYQEEAAGLYQIAGKKGHFGLRGINMKIPGLKSDKPHGTWGWVNGKGRMVQDRDPKKIKFIDAPYLHTTFLRRAGTKEADKQVIKRAKKLKHEIGIEFPPDYFYPEVFFRERPEIVKSPWEVMDGAFKKRAMVETPLRKIKRRVLPGRVGY